MVSILLISPVKTTVLASATPVVLLADLEEYGMVSGSDPCQCPLTVVGMNFHMLIKYFTINK